MVALGLHFEEEDGEEESGDDGSSSHHLVDGACDEVEGHVLEGGGDEVADCGNGEQEFVELDFFSLGLGFEHAHFESFCVPVLHDEEHDEGERLSEEHGGGLSGGAGTCM